MTQAKAQAQKEGKSSFFLYTCLCLRLPCSHIVSACACIIHVNIPFSVVTVTLACMQTSSAPAKIGKEIFAGGGGGMSARRLQLLQIGRNKKTQWCMSLLQYIIQVFKNKGK